MRSGSRSARLRPEVSPLTSAESQQKVLASHAPMPDTAEGEQPESQEEERRGSRHPRLHIGLKEDHSGARRPRHSLKKEKSRDILEPARLGDTIERGAICVGKGGGVHVGREPDVDAFVVESSKTIRNGTGTRETPPFSDEEGFQMKSWNAGEGNVGMEYNGLARHLRSSVPRGRYHIGEVVDGDDWQGKASRGDGSDPGEHQGESEEEQARATEGHRVLLIVTRAMVSPAETPHGEPAPGCRRI